MSLKRLLFRALGKDPEAVVVSFLSGPPDQARAMLVEVLQLIPDRQHYAVGAELDVSGVTYLKPHEARQALKRKRVGMAPALISWPEYASLRRLAFRFAPTKVLGYNSRLERHHLHPATLIASWLFWRGLPLDRIHLRPRWWPTHDRTVKANELRVIEGRPSSPSRRQVGVVSPYLPYPLAHGGAVRIYNLLSRAAARYDIHLFCFVEDLEPAHIEVMRSFCFRLYLVANTRYREPRWSTMLPPEVHEFDSPVLRRALEHAHVPLVQAEYTQMAVYKPDILVEHDVTFDLYEQTYRARPTVATRWDFWRWRRFERRALDQARRVVVMSDKDSTLAGAGSKTRVIPNGVDLARFVPEPERAGCNVLFVGSFRHEPNRTAYSFFVNNVWPKVKRQLEAATLTVVAGPAPEVFWPDLPPPAPGETRHAFVEDVRPLYVDANLVVVPTLQSAGTNLKVLEALAMKRALVSTTTGCQGFGLQDGVHLRIEDDPARFASAILALFADPAERQRLADSARRVAEEHYDWDRIAELQCALWDELLS